MGDDERNMQIRKFLKRVGVESHEAIEAALQTRGGTIAVKVVLMLGDEDTPAKVFESTITT